MPTLSVRVDKKLSDQSHMLAELTGRTQTSHIRQALEAYLSQKLPLVNAVERGIEEADRGDFTSEEEVKAVNANWGVEVDNG